MKDTDISPSSSVKLCSSSSPLFLLVPISCSSYCSQRRIYCFYSIAYCFVLQSQTSTGKVQAFPKLLGVTIRQTIRFSEHITTTCKMASQRIGVITNSRLKNLIPTMAKLQLYKAAILPHLTYCHLIWHFCRASDSRRLEKNTRGFKLRSRLY